MSIIEALEKEIEDLREFKKQWDEKDGNSPGYNLEKAKTYGNIGVQLKAQLEKHQARMGAIIQRGDSSEADIELYQETTDFLNQKEYAFVGFDENEAKKRANAFAEKCTDCGNVPSRTYRIFMAGQRAQHKAMTIEKAEPDQFSEENE